MFIFGASSRTRTNDRWITNLVLYQLSYRGALKLKLARLRALRLYSATFYSTLFGPQTLRWFTSRGDKTSA